MPSGMDHRVQELARSRTRFVLRGSAARTSRRIRLIINALGPDHIYNLHQFPSDLDIAAIAVFRSAGRHPIKHRPPATPGTHRPPRRLQKSPFQGPVAPQSEVTPLGL